MISTSHYALRRSDKWIQDGVESKARSLPTTPSSQITLRPLHCAADAAVVTVVGSHNWIPQSRPSVHPLYPAKVFVAVPMKWLSGQH
ncbi:unnamed protein product [Pleuronectes platessa]|uniref:Uncharacterized protein n=1 Tax=Pleuronectes platessa TaxID=8262 RepID=A0A9N7YJB1_PLEPL|nr:unnamed protein product [Pleuronectes platessa]